MQRWDQRTEYGVQITEGWEGRAKVQIGLRPVQRCKGEVREQSTEYGLQRRQQRGMVGWSIEYGGKVGTWLRRVLLG